MESKKVLSSLCYFSVFFAGFIFPLVVMLASSDPDTKQHAKKALLSHLIPVITVPIIIFAAIKDFSNMQDQIPVFFVISIVVTIVISLVIFIWNIVKGVKVLVSE
ncbi:DUF4870 domain-containing protein [Neobacillus sp. LXY-1]|uniref:DUF4870 domain-containing protein n=1 Tax=Neobacillus sp. LXY-1 TaxID=3379133 RepID=UPI003EE38C13